MEPTLVDDLVIPQIISYKPRKFRLWRRNSILDFIAPNGEKTQTALPLEMADRGSSGLIRFINLQGPTENNAGTSSVVIKKLQETGMEACMAHLEETNKFQGIYGKKSAWTNADPSDSSCTPVIVMYKFPGKNLGDRIYAHCLPPAISLDFIRVAAIALKKIHDKGFVHGDVQPKNVNIYRDKQKNLAARWFDFANASNNGAAYPYYMTFTPIYMAPELKGKHIKGMYWEPFPGKTEPLFSVSPSQKATPNQDIYSFLIITQNFLAWRKNHRDGLTDKEKNVFNSLNTFTISALRALPEERPSLDNIITKLEASLKTLNEPINSAPRVSNGFTKQISTSQNYPKALIFGALLLFVLLIIAANSAQKSSAMTLS